MMQEFQGQVKVGNCAELSDHGTIPADQSLFNVVLPYIYMYINQYCQIYRTHI